jgi:hypothetical protein
MVSFKGTNKIIFIFLNLLIKWWHGI